MVIEVMDKKNEEAYEKFLEGHHGSFFHTLGWRRILHNTYGYKQYYLMSYEHNTVGGILPLMLVKSSIFGNHLSSLPYTPQCGVLAKSKEHEKALVAKAKSLTKSSKCDYLVIKDRVRFSEGMEEVSPFVGSTLDITKSEEELWKGMEKKSARWGVKKAMKHGVSIQESTKVDEYKLFYRLLLETRKRQGIPPYPFTLFEELSKHPDCVLCLAKYNAIPVAGIVIARYKDTAYYLYGATSTKKQYRELNATNLLLWEAIKKAKKKGVKTFDFGTTSKNHRNLLRFKVGFGTTQTEVPYTYQVIKGTLPNTDSSSKKFETVTSIWKRLPLPVTRVVGSKIAKQLG